MDTGEGGAQHPHLVPRHEAGQVGDVGLDLLGQFRVGPFGLLQSRPGIDVVQLARSQKGKTDSMSG
ncbi:hypothetical protein H480_20869 [Amycolatopsis vancoresmycina DSM 44592]|uniref:Uncharacterized protein n=1 Tax=Amycolatopsis vancoresmycina DSM 44592 TaxID=1292037 RepID=R1I845_9PSEU|nr:hypothetical protein H480_20869 [Amycolatopsis vancoresmycina DSM 44592]